MLHQLLSPQLTKHISAVQPIRGIGAFLYIFQHLLECITAAQEQYQAQMLGQLAFLILILKHTEYPLRLMTRLVF